MDLKLEPYFSYEESRTENTVAREPNLAERIKPEPTEADDTLESNLNLDCIKNEPVEQEDAYFSYGETRIENFPETTNLEANLDAQRKQVEQEEIVKSSQFDFFIRTAQDEAQQNPKPRPMIKCDLCDKQYTTNFKLKIHLLKHENEGKYYECPICQKQHRSMKILDNHIKTHNPELLCFKCEICVKGFVSQSRLDSHMLRHSERTFSCRLCSNKYKSAGYLKNHLAKYHHQAEADSDECSEVRENASFSHEETDVVENNVIHEASLEGNVEIKEELVDQGHYASYEENNLSETNLETSLGNVQKEKEAVNNEPQHSEDENHYECQVCQKQLRSIKVLNNHMKIHNPHLLRFNCKICAKAFLSYNRLDSHMLCHSEAKFKCDLCNKSYKTAGHLKNHLAKSHPKAEGEASMEIEIEVKNEQVEEEVPVAEKPIFKCVVCSAEFTSRSEQLRHHRQHKKKEKFFKCRICAKEFLTIKTLRLHKLYHDESSFQFKCTVCSKAFTTKAQFEQHSMIHEERKFQCDKCNTKFRTNSILLRHLATHHAGNQHFECQICGLKLALNKSLRKHLIVVHGIGKTIKCNACTREFYSEDGLRRHSNLMHSADKNVQLKCHKCGKQNKNNYNFKRHMLTHVYEKCSFCSKLVKKLHLDSHIEKHKQSLLQLKCPVCRKLFPEASFEAHVNAKDCTPPEEHSNKEINYSVCNICDRHFCSKSKLKNHMRIHTGDYINCAQCDAKFTSVYNHNKHVQSVHTPHENKPFVCHICGKGSVFKNVFETHLKTHEVAKIRCEICSDMVKGEKMLILHKQKKHNIHCVVKEEPTELCNEIPKPPLEHNNKTEISSAVKFASSYNYSQHIKSVHAPLVKICGKDSDSKNEIRCDICSDIVESENMLILHKQMKHCAVKQEPTDFHAEAPKVET